MISGLGPVTSIGVGKEDVWHSIEARRQNFAVHRETLDGFSLGEFTLATVDDQQLLHVIGSEFSSPAINNRNGRNLALFFAACRLAVEDAGLSADSMPRIGVVVAHENPGFDEYTSQIWQSISGAFAKPPESALRFITDTYQTIQDAGYETHSFVLLQRLTRLLGAHGPAQIVNNACASGLFALETAAAWIRGGHVDAMLVVGGDSPRQVTRYLWLNAAKACTGDPIMRPFDRRRNGFLLGEGAGALLLESQEHATARGRTPYTEYLSGAFACDAWKLTVPCMRPNYYSMALQDSLDRAQCSAEEIDLIVPHGAASPLQDKYESDAIASVFGAHLDLLLATALKPYIGHTLAGSAILELILTLLSLEQGIVPATLNCEEPDPRLSLRPVTQHTKTRIRTWVKASTGFGGFHASCVFRQKGASR